MKYGRLLRRPAVLPMTNQELFSIHTINVPEMLFSVQQETDSGIYTCVASSATGESSWSGTLTVRGNHGACIRRVSLFLTLTSHLCAHQTTPAVLHAGFLTSSKVKTVWWKRNHTSPIFASEYGVYSSSRVSEFIQLPGPPQKPVMTEVTKNTVTLTWQSNPHEGGAAVTSYIIEAFRYALLFLTLSGGAHPPKPGAKGNI